MVKAFTPWGVEVNFYTLWCNGQHCKEYPWQELCSLWFAVIGPIQSKFLNCRAAQCHNATISSLQLTLIGKTKSILTKTSQNTNFFAAYSLNDK